MSLLKLKVNILDFKLATPEEVCLELGRRLKIQRLSKNFKQQDLADRAGVSVGTIKNLEAHGHSSLETWIRVSAALDLIQEIEPLFRSKIRSIAEMEKTEQAFTLRKRAR